MAHWHLAQMYRRGFGVPRDWAAAAEWCRSAIELGDVRGYVVLGELYADGLNGSPDMAAALDAWNTGADGDDPDGDCVYRLAVATLQGHRPDREEAIPLLSRAIDLGSLEAAVHRMSMIVEETQDEDMAQTAVTVYRQCLEAFIPQAGYELGKLYEVGRGVPKDVERAKELYRHAALHGWKTAQTRLDALNGVIPVARRVIPVTRRVDRKPNE